jgi:hypothetical protein
MTKADQLADALQADGWTIEGLYDERTVTARRGNERVQFSRFGTKGTFTTTNTNLEGVRAVQRKYAEVGMRTFAKKNGYMVSKGQDEREFVLNKRSK